MPGWRRGYRLQLLEDTVFPGKAQSNVRQFLRIQFENFQLLDLKWARFERVPRGFNNDSQILPLGNSFRIPENVK